MSLPSASNDPHALPPGSGPEELPPVEPPTAGFIVQLFVIPAVIVGVVVVVWLLFGRLAGSDDVAGYVRTIQSGNDNRRYRAAFDLASLIHNDAKLARDPALLGQLTSLLDHELSRGDERVRIYLTLALGSFQTLETRGGKGSAPDLLATLASALAPSQPTTVRQAAAVSLARQAAQHDGQLTDPRAVGALTEASTDQDVELRQRATYALGFFGGEPAADALRQRLEDSDRFVGYNAAVALGRRGDLASLPMLREMLSTRDLNQVIRIESPTEKTQKIATIELDALRALQTAAQAGKLELPRRLHREVHALTRSDLADVQVEARNLLKVLPASQ